MGLITVLGSTHAVEQLSFSMISLILTIEFDLILGSFFTFLGSNGLFLGLGYGSKKGFGSSIVLEQLLFSIVSLILTLDFDLIFGSVFDFLGPYALFLGSG